MMKETLPSVEARLLEEIDRAGRCGAYQAVVVAAVRRSLWGNLGKTRTAQFEHVTTYIP